MFSPSLVYKQLFGGLLALFGVALWSPQGSARSPIEQGSLASEVSNSTRAVPSDDAPTCVPRGQCCKVCSKGKACGNSCIRADYNCHKGAGCACDEADLCE